MTIASHRATGRCGSWALRRVSGLVLMVVLAGVGPAQTGDTTTLDLGEGVKVELVRIPAGEFLMGENHITRSLTGFFGPHEFFGRTVRLSRSFRTGKYEVTVKQFRRFVEATGYQTDAESGQRTWGGLRTGLFTVVDGAWRKNATASWRNPGFSQEDDHPVTGISWYDATAFCEWVSSRTRRACRLPTEAELEYAQRARTPTRYFWGIGMDEKGAWANVADSDGLQDDDVLGDNKHLMKNVVPEDRNDNYRYTAPVGMFHANAFGLYDAIGNVWEYTLDWAGVKPALADPRGTGDEKVRSMRGGSWISTPDLYRSSFRPEIEPESRTSTRGMRLVVEVAP